MSGHGYFTPVQWMKWTFMVPLQNQHCPSKCRSQFLSVSGVNCNDQIQSHGYNHYDLTYNIDRSRRNSDECFIIICICSIVNIHQLVQNLYTLFNQDTISGLTSIQNNRELRFVSKINTTDKHQDSVPLLEKRRYSHWKKLLRRRLVNAFYIE